MIYNRRRFRAVTIGTILAIGAIAAQSPQTPVTKQDEKATIFRSDTRLVVLHAVDKNGRFVTGLPREAFTVFENGAQQEIRIFRNEDVPVSLGLVIDNSGSMPTSGRKWRPPRWRW